MKKSVGELIAEKRKEKGMTQLQLAEKMGVTDKAVSKWERDLSCPDIGTIPRLAQELGVTVEELMQGESRQPGREQERRQLFRLILRALGLAMGVAVAVLGTLGRLDSRSAAAMLGLGLAAVSLDLLQN